jgi:hypothetical protein
MPAVHQDKKANVESQEKKRLTVKGGDTKERK